MTNSKNLLAFLDEKDWERFYVNIREVGSNTCEFFIDDHVNIQAIPEHIHDWFFDVFKKVALDGEWVAESGLTFRLEEGFDHNKIKSIAKMVVTEHDFTNDMYEHVSIDLEVLR